jgi:hypothetical protein
LLTWLQEKIGPGSYIIPLGFALLYFFALLVFTTYLRFNFLWGFEKQFTVDPESTPSNMSFPYWLTTAMCSIVLGIALLSIPVIGLGFGWLRIKEATPPKEASVKVECNCKPAQTVPPPASTQPKPVRHHRRSSPSQPAR